jgi:Solute carrier family 12
MLMIDVGFALISLVLVGLIYLAVKRRELTSSWFDIHQGILSFFAQYILYRLTPGNSAAKSWRPHFLVFTKFSEEHSVTLLKFTEAIGQSKGFLTTASFVPRGTLTVENQKEMQQNMETRFKNHNIRSFVKVIESSSLTNGIKHMLDYYGLGPLIPNTILFGGIKKGEKSADFVQIIHSAISKHYNVVIMSDEVKPDVQGKNLNRDIHVWWDDCNADNSDFMLVLAHMLQRNGRQKNRRICVKSIVSDETLKKNKQQQLLELSITKRLPVEIKVYVSSSDTSAQLNLIKEFSKEAEIVLMGLNPPPTSADNIDTYIDYIQLLSETMDSLPTLTLTLSSEHTPLNVILS